MSPSNLLSPHSFSSLRRSDALQPLGRTQHTFSMSRPYNSITILLVTPAHVPLVEDSTHARRVRFIERQMCEEANVNRSTRYVSALSKEACDSKSLHVTACHSMSSVSFQITSRTVAGDHTRSSGRPSKALSAPAQSPDYNSR